jgi:hypothetical protein
VNATIQARVMQATEKELFVAPGRRALQALQTEGEEGEIRMTKSE